MKAISVNMENGAITEYTNFDFNSLCVLNGKVLAASDAGITLLEGDDDKGTGIVPIFQTGLTDFGTSLKKNMPDAYITGKGIVSLNTMQDNGTEGSKFDSGGGLFATRKVRLPLGSQSVLWGLQVTSIDKDMLIEKIELIPELATRRGA